MEYFVGQRAEITKTISAEDVERFTELSGDNNPLHMASGYDKNLPFSGRVCHGLLAASYISAVLGTKLPGPGTVYLGQTLSFRKPVYVGDTVTAKAEIVSIREEKEIITLKTTIIKQNGDCAIEGEAVVKVFGHD